MTFPLDALDYKFHRLDLAAPQTDPFTLEGYAAVFGEADKGGDIIAPGAFTASLARRHAGVPTVKLLWQHDPAQPIGVWEALHEDARGLRVRGRLLPEVRTGEEAASLLRAGALDGLSIGYRAVKAEKVPGGLRRLTEIDLWEISLVTFPMASGARVDPAGGAAETEMALAINEAASAFRIN